MEWSVGTIAEWVIFVALWGFFVWQLSTRALRALRGGRSL